MGAELESKRVGGVGRLLVLSAVVCLPLAGAALSGRELRSFFVFPPPLEVPTDYATFSWIAVGTLLAALGAYLATWLGRHRLSPQVQAATETPNASRKMPGWTWPAVTWTLAWWLIAWTRLPAFEPVQPYTFFPLWLGFVVILNALAQMRTGTCLMTRSPRGWVTLFAASAGFWWLFEWLNRFVRNWHYLGVESFGPAAYALHATLCFSTVLPAVGAMAEILGSFAALKQRLGAGPRWTWLGRREVGFALLVLGGGGLLLTGAFPRFFYPALWSAPLALFFGTEIVSRRRWITARLAAGDWRAAGTWMLAALACGFFWEMWNAPSLAKWIYTVPGVGRWHVFEMPLLGYLGYLPFGVECLLITRYVAARDPVTP